MLAEGKKPQALKAFDRAIADSPSDRNVFLAVIEILMREELYAESVPYIERAIALEDEEGSERMLDSELYTYLGNASWQMEDLAGAEKAYETAIRLNEKNATAYNNWGYMLAESNQQLDKALELTIKADELAPKTGVILDSVGWAYFQKGDPHKALEYLRQAAVLVPSDVEVRLHYARALDACGDKKAALIEYRKVLKLAPSNELAKERIRTLYLKNASQ